MVNWASIPFMVSMVLPLALAGCGETKDDLVLKGDKATMSGKTEEAMGHYRGAMAMDPGDLNIPFKMAAAYHRAGKHEEEEAALKALLSNPLAVEGQKAMANQRMADCWVTRANLAKSLSDEQEQAYRKALEYEKGKANAHQGLAELYMARGSNLVKENKLREAAEQFERIADLQTPSSLKGKANKRADECYREAFTASFPQTFAEKYEKDLVDKGFYDPASKALVAVGTAEGPPEEEAALKDKAKTMAKDMLQEMVLHMAEAKTGPALAPSLFVTVEESYDKKAYTSKLQILYEKWSKAVYDAWRAKMRASKAPAKEASAPAQAPGKEKSSDKK